MTTRSKPEVAPRSALDEALFHLAEECCELGKAASKMYRFGPDHRKKKDGPTNEERLFEEFGDVEYWLSVVSVLLTLQYDAQKKTPARTNPDGGTMPLFAEDQLRSITPTALSMADESYAKDL